MNSKRNAYIKAQTTSGEFVNVTMNEAKSSGINDFRKWKCFNATQNLWISYTGKVYGSVCRARYLGNIFSDEIALLKEPSLCEKANCYCADDILIPKTRTTLKELKTIESVPFNHLQNCDNRPLTAIAGSEELKMDTLTANWTMAKLCNYDCSYCPPTTHNKLHPHMTSEKINRVKNTLTRLSKEFSSLKLIVTGGEPTLHPNYLEFLKEINFELNDAKVFTNTNGSRPINYLYKLTQLSGIHLSLHFEYDMKKTLEKIKLLSEYRSRSGFNKNRFVVKLMASPGGLAKIESAYNQLLEIQSYVSNKALSIRVEPLVLKSEQYEIHRYTTDEKTKIAEMNIY